MLRVCLVSGWLALGVTVVTAQDVSRGEVVITGSRVTLRSEPRVAPQTAIGVVSRGDRLELAAQRDDWIQVRTADGRLAWLNARYCRVELPSVPETGSPPVPSPGAAGEAAPEPGATDVSAAPALSTEDEAGIVASPPAGAMPETADATSTGVSTAEESPVGPEPGSVLSADPVPAAVADRAEGPAAEPEAWWGHSPLVAAGVALLAVLVGVGFWLRHRRLRRVFQGTAPVSRADLARVLAKLDERRRQEDERLSREFTRLKSTIEAGAGDPERLTRRLDELRAAIVAQQQRLDAYSDLLAAQNGKLAALEEENRVLRALLTGTRQ
ncbi:MAG: hypothetical protein Kow001_16450 [Acidobacteriota bacterium]